MNQVRIAGLSILDARLDLVKARSGRIVVQFGLYTTLSS
jgi:hypothetical protein